MLIVLGSKNVTFGPISGVHVWGHQERPRAEPVGLRHHFFCFLRGTQNGPIFEGSRGRPKNDPCAPWDGQGTNKTPRRTARSSVLSSWLPRRGSRGRQGLIKINQKTKKLGGVEDLTRYGPRPGELYICLICV